MQASLPIDKSMNLLEGDEAAKDRDWQKAAESYKDALASTDPGVRVTATREYQHARGEMRGLWWKQKFLHRIGTYFRENWVEFTARLILCSLFAVLLGFLAFRKRMWLLDRLPRLFKHLFGTSTSPIIMTPLKYTTDAPSELFAAEMMAAGENVRSILANVLAAPVVHSRHGTSMTLYLPSQGFQQAIEALPDIKGVELGKIAKFVLAMFRFFSWRVESGIGFANNQVVGIASLRQAWTMTRVWRATAPSSSPLDVAPVARELAYNILGLPFVD
jgi:hypothetical protein